MYKVVKVVPCLGLLAFCQCSSGAGLSVSLPDASHGHAGSGSIAGASGLGAGGVTGFGGIQATGGNVAVGGNNSPGGAMSKGGNTISNQLGGSPSSGGIFSAGGTSSMGGTMAAGGAKPSGGAKATGGAKAAGGINGMGGGGVLGGATAPVGGTTGVGSGTSTTGITCTPQIWASVPNGWATVSGNTIGGGNASATVVNSLSALNSAAGGSGTAAIHVSGKIGPGIVKIGSNKTILGLCGAEIDGSIDMTGSSNVIMRNLKIVGYNCSDSPSDCSAGHDAVHVENGDHHLWFDHLDISDGSDGNLDITHGCDFITISWTKFHYSSKRTDPANNYGHRFSNLIGHDDANGSEDAGHLNVTFDHVWWADNVAERMPRVRFGKVHIFNNLYTASGNSSAIGVGVGCSIRVENSVFQNISSPADSSHANSASILQSIGDQGLTTNIGGSAFAPNYSYTLEDVTTVAASVQTGAGPK